MLFCSRRLCRSLDHGNLHRKAAIGMPKNHPVGPTGHNITAQVLHALTPGCPKNSQSAPKRERSQLFCGTASLKLCMRKHGKVILASHTVFTKQTTENPLRWKARLHEIRVPAVTFLKSVWRCVDLLGAPCAHQNNPRSPFVTHGKHTEPFNGPSWRGRRESDCGGVAF